MWFNTIPHAYEVSGYVCKYCRYVFYPKPGQSKRVCPQCKYKLDQIRGKIDDTQPKSRR